eukprot:INCI10945.1.p1 GENE.INCI10945.1~~INCI10945.1.p1  ORF type:complete len:183 (+),score=42.32 INCI10945.1:110-658(+)
MGNFVSQMMALFNPQKERKILMLGLDAAGKTTILTQLKLGEVRNTTPTIGFNVEAVQFKNIDFTVWDVGGQEKLRGLWRHYYEGANALIFVVDSNDPSRVKTARSELQKILQEDTMREVVVLVFANKQDLPNAMTPSQLSEALDLGKLTAQTTKKKWWIQGCCGTNGTGLAEGLAWLSKELQ